MYAILAHGGRQHRVTAGDRIVVDRLDAEPGTIVHLQPVLFTADGGKTALGKDVDGVRVAASVVQHLRGEKIRVFKYRAKKRTRRTMGHRSDLTELIVEGILARGEEHTGAPRAARTARKPVATGRKTGKRAPARSRTATPRSRPAKPASVRATAAKRAPAKAKPATAGAGSKKAAASSAPTAKRQAAAKATTRKAPAKAAAKPTAAGSAAKAKPASKAQPAAKAKPAAKRTGTGAKRSSTRRSGDGA